MHSHHFLSFYGLLFFSAFSTVHCLVHICLCVCLFGMAAAPEIYVLILVVDDTMHLVCFLNSICQTERHFLSYISVLKYFKDYKHIIAMLLLSQAVCQQIHGYAADSLTG